MNAFDYIRRTYHVPAKRGMTVRYYSRTGRILSANGQYLMVKMDDCPVAKPYHPLDITEYVESAPSRKAEVAA